MLFPASLCAASRQRYMDTVLPLPGTLPPEVKIKRQAGLTVEAADDPAGVGACIWSSWPGRRENVEGEQIQEQSLCPADVSPRPLQSDGPALQVTPSRGLFAVLTCWRASTQDAHAA